jgi:diguanylate cyclase (GGDEF)-like protein/PAS domain S-box-containing protein
MHKLVHRFPTLPLLLLSLSWLFLCAMVELHPASTLNSALTLLPLPVEQQMVVATLFMLPLLGILNHQKRLLSHQLTEQEQAHQQALKVLKSQYNQEENQLRTLMQSDQIAYWEWDVKANQARFSPQWKKMLGLELGHPLNNLHDLQNRIHPKDQEAVQKQFLKVLSGEHKRFECTHRVQHQDGHYLWVHDKGQIFYSPYGEIEKLSAIRLDVSEQKWIEAELELDATIIEHSSEGIAIADSHQHILRCNQALLNTLNCTQEEIQAKRIPDLIAMLQPDNPPDLMQVLGQDDRWRGELTHHSQQGELLLASIVHIQKIYHETTQQLHYSLLITDITDLKRSQQTLDNLANIDKVTGLASRNKLYQALDLALRQEPRIILFFMDLDNFKAVNDSLGHDIGDELLHQVGQTIRNLAGDQALISRIGGDEFVLFFGEQKNQESAIELARQLTQALAKPFKLHGHAIQIGSSIGIARYPDDANERQSLMKAADIAMYEAKRAGKGQYRLYAKLDHDKQRA